MRPQVKLVFQIGFQSSHMAIALVSAFENDVARAASGVCGGCTTDHRKGWWAADGATHADRFIGEVQSEDCLTVEVTCEPGKVQDAYNACRDAITDAAVRYKIDTDWVHVSEFETTGRHFSVAARAYAMADRSVTDNAMRMQMDPPARKARVVHGYTKAD